jgi:hypothetical protein
MRLARIVSGGQTGADRAALDVALECGLELGGWVPRGRLAEDGAIPDRYTGLVETRSADPAVRTARNARDSDATLILSHGALVGGSRLAFEEAGAAHKPVLHLDLHSLCRGAAVARLRAWLAEVEPRCLNVAGPRASEDPAIHAATRAVLGQALRRPGAPRARAGSATGRRRARSGRAAPG